MMWMLLPLSAPEGEDFMPKWDAAGCPSRPPSWAVRRGIITRLGNQRHSEQTGEEIQNKAVMCFRIKRRSAAGPLQSISCLASGSRSPGYRGAEVPEPGG